MAESIGGNPVIYTITSGENLFVGATTNFEKKRQSHKTSISAHRKEQLEDVRSLYQIIAANNFKWEMKVLKEFPCENRTQMNAEVKRLEKELNTNMDLKPNTKEKSTNCPQKGDFSNAVVYTIQTDKDIFVGSTTNFEKRKTQIANKIFSPNEDSELFTTIRKNKNKWIMKVHSQVECQNWRQLRKEEDRIRALLENKEEEQQAEVAPEPVQEIEIEKDQKKTIFTITAKRYAFVGATDDFDAEKEKYTDYVAQYKRGRLMYHQVITEWISMADFDWSIDFHSEFEFGSLTNTTDGYHDLPEVEAEIERIRMGLKKTGDYDYVDSRAQQLIYREQEWTLIPDPVGWAAEVEDLEELPEKFFHRRIGKFYNFNGAKVFWASRHIRCVHHSVKHKICRNCLLDPTTDKKSYLRGIDYYKMVEEKRYRRGG